MPAAKIVLEGDGAFKDEAKRYGDHFVWVEDPVLKFARLEGGMASGASSVAIGFDLDGKYIVFQTSLATLENAVRAMMIRDGMKGKGPKV